jgi:putative ABC transport system ATP-binding protein
MNPSSNHLVVEAENLTKIYRRGAEEVRALRNVALTIARGEFVAIVGPSGSGKTTLLNLVGCMDSPTSGWLRLEGQEAEHLDESGRTRLRRERLGFVFQHFALVPTLTVAENVALPLLFARRSAPGRVDALLEKVGLSARRDHRPHQLSGGEMQRVSIARSLVNEPVLLLADEPTGQLDIATGNHVIDLFRRLHAEGLTLLVATHNPALALAAQRQLRLVDGRIIPAILDDGA